MLDDLNAADFEVRFIALPWDRVETVEQALIKLYAPLWNVALPGFGNKHPGKGRSGQRRSDIGVTLRIACCLKTGMVNMPKQGAD